jgi:hypothetical protein
LEFIVSGARGAETDLTGGFWAFSSENAVREIWHVYRWDVLETDIS